MRATLIAPAEMRGTTFATESDSEARVSGHQLTAAGPVPVGPLVARAFRRFMGCGGLPRETNREMFSLAPAVKRNRSIAQSTVIPVLIYPDVRAAVEWLGAAFGFVECVRIGENHRAQTSFGDGAVIVGDVRGERRPSQPGEVTHSVMVRVDAATGRRENE